MAEIIMDTIDPNDVKRLTRLSARVLDLSGDIQRDIDAMPLPEWARENWTRLAFALRDAEQLQLCCWCDRRIGTTLRGLDLLCDGCAAKRDEAEA